MKSGTFTTNTAIKEELALLRQIVFGNPQNCELVERGPRRNRQVLLALAILNLPEIVRFIVDLFS